MHRRRSNELHQYIPNPELMLQGQAIKTELRAITKAAFRLSEELGMRKNQDMPQTIILLFDKLSEIKGSLLVILEDTLTFFKRRTTAKELLAVYEEALIDAMQKNSIKPELSIVFYDTLCDITEKLNGCTQYIAQAFLNLPHFTQEKEILINTIGWSLLSIHKLLKELKIAYDACSKQVVLD